MLIVITPFPISTLVLPTLTFRSIVIVAFSISPSQPAHIVFVNATVVVLVRETPFTTAFASMTAVPGDVAEVRVVVAKPTTVVPVGGAMLPSVVENVTSTPSTQPSSSVTKAVMFAIAVPFASITSGSAVRTIAGFGFSKVSIFTDFCASAMAKVSLVGMVLLHDITYK